MARPIGFLMVIALLAGCSSSSGELGKKDNDDLRNSFTRKLTPAEIKLLQSAKPPNASGPPTKPNP